jgi:hypothetical protein
MEATSMKRIGPTIVAISAVAAGAAGATGVAGVARGGVVPAARAIIPAAGSWGRAIEVPGLAALNTAGDAHVASVSCASAGNCAAGGYYSGHSNGAFVVVERHGRWAKAIEVPGLAALNNPGYGALVNTVSCASAGSCAAGGDYVDRRAARVQVFVTAERNGRWSKAIEVPGLAALNTGSPAYGAQVISMSCASAGNCTYGGFYQRRHSQQGFVASERNGTWGKATDVPGLAGLNTGGGAAVNSVSCASPGNCVAGGYYATGNLAEQGFVAVERHGVWSKAIKVPGLSALSKGGGGPVDSVSCASPGNCAVAGTSLVIGGGWQGFVAAERNGRWTKATAVPGLAALNTGGFAEVNSVSCASPGNCALGGDYTGHTNAGFVAVERSGRWGEATQVPGLAALGRGAVESVSCAPAGNCAAGGYYVGRARLLRGFVITRENGRWSKATGVPGLAALDKGRKQPFAQVTFYPTVSCAPGGTCTAGGSYTDASNHAQGFVTQTR